MIVNVICAAVETFVEIAICFGLFIKAYGIDYKDNKYRKAVVSILILSWFLFKTLNNIISIFSFTAIVIVFPVMTALLWLIVRSKFTRIAAWCFFDTMSNNIIKLPTLVITGLVYNEAVSNTNLVKSTQIWAKVINGFIFIVIFVIYIKKNKVIVKHFANMPHQQTIFWFIGFIGYIIIAYVMYLGWNGFTIQTFILTICLILMLFMFIVCLIIILEYHIMIRMNNLLKSKENNIKANYLLVAQEIERNRKINHDNKHDLEYLYHCFENKDYEHGIMYIKQKENNYNRLQKNLIWTGYGSIDFLINRAKARADEKKILFTIKVDIVEIPIEEYDFFSVLSNLLDNAIEASMQNDESEGYISLQILSLNNVFKLRLENSYLIEPVKRDKRFISHKGDNDMHGWGIENVKEIVKKYNGRFDINYGDGIFLAIIVLIQ